MPKQILQVQPIASYDDNYIWLLSDGYFAVVVDPGDAQPVIAYLKEHHLELKSILITHHHADHVGGIVELHDWALASGWDAPAVYGPMMENIPLRTESLMQGDSLHLQAPACEVFVVEVPGHTLGHLAFYVEAGQSKHLFCGDTLFASGCGRVFEGTPSQMFDSLMKLKGLPDDTWIHCAHEYTLSNIKFALAVEPQNQDLLDWKIKAQALRNAGKPTLPTTMAHEKRVNPFLRSNMPSVVAGVVKSQPLVNEEPVHVFAALRAWKDGFK
jgi:hydroxyacylglutathione hydrolase